MDPALHTRMCKYHVAAWLWRGWMGRDKNVQRLIATIALIAAKCKLVMCLIDQASGRPPVACVHKQIQPRSNGFPRWEIFSPRVPVLPFTPVASEKTWMSWILGVLLCEHHSWLSYLFLCLLKSFLVSLECVFHLQRYYRTTWSWRLFSISLVIITT